MPNPQAASRLQKFLVRWMTATVPNLSGLRVQRERVLVKDSLGWRDVGPLKDYAQVARAAGVI